MNKINKKYIALLLAAGMLTANATGWPAGTISDFSVNLFAKAENYGDLSYENQIFNINITGCSDSATELNIPSEIDGLAVKGIKTSAFYDKKNLVSVTVPDSVVTIGNSAFANCTNLRNVSLGNGVTAIDYNTFQNCESLVSITIPDSVKKIGKDSFNGCSALSSVTFGSKVSTIDTDSFYNCSSLTDIVLPESVANIKDGAFYGCSSLRSVTIKNPDCVIYDSKYTISKGTSGDKNITIYGYANSTAETYAKNYGYTFALIGSSSEQEIPTETLPETTTTTTTQTTATTSTTTSTTTQTTTTTTTSTTTQTTTTTTTTTTPETITTTTASTTPETTTSTTTTTTTTPETTVTQPVQNLPYGLGDVNYNNEVNAEDASLILQDAAQKGASGWGIFGDDQRNRGDIDRDGNSNSADAAMVLQYAAYRGSGAGEKSIAEYFNLQ